MYSLDSIKSIGCFPDKVKSLNWRLMKSRFGIHSLDTPYLYLCNSRNKLTKIDKTVNTSVTNGDIDGSIVWWNSCTSPPVITADSVFVIFIMLYFLPATKKEASFKTRGSVGWACVTHLSFCFEEFNTEPSIGGSHQISVHFGKAVSDKKLRNWPI